MDFTQLQCVCVCVMVTVQAYMCEWHSRSQLQTELQCEQRRNKTDKTEETDKQGFPHWCSCVHLYVFTAASICARVCVLHMHACRHVSFFVIGDERAYNGAVDLCWGSQSTHTCTHSAAAAVCSSHLHWKHSGEKEAESGNGKGIDGVSSVRLLHCSCQNAILFNKLGRIEHFSLTKSVRQLPQPKWHQHQQQWTDLPSLLLLCCPSEEIRGAH